MKNRNMNETMTLTFNYIVEGPQSYKGKSPNNRITRSHAHSQIKSDVTKYTTHHRYSLSFKRYNLVSPITT